MVILLLTENRILLLPLRSAPSPPPGRCSFFVLTSASAPPPPVRTRRSLPALFRAASPPPDGSPPAECVPLEIPPAGAPSPDKNFRRMPPAAYDRTHFRDNAHDKTSPHRQARGRPLFPYPISYRQQETFRFLPLSGNAPSRSRKPPFPTSLFAMPGDGRFRNRPPRRPARQRPIQKSLKGKGRFGGGGETFSRKFPLPLPNLHFPNLFYFHTLWRSA